MQLRYYQEEAILSVYSYFQEKTGNPILALPTGTGKSVIIAEFCRSVLFYFPGQRILMLTHVKELIAQNYEKLLTVWPMAPAGIYSAGLGKKEVRPITFAGIASVAKKAAELGHFDIVVIDECHLVSPKLETSYQNLIADLQRINPALKVVGLTATPYRLGQGLLTEPVDTPKGPRPSLFSDIAYDLTSFEKFNKLVAEGYLCRLRSKRSKKNEIDTSRVGTVAGEFNLQDLQAAVDREEITRRAISETIEIAAEEGRKRWLIFATGVEHASHVTEELKARGFAARCVTSDTPDKERDEAVTWFREKTEDIRVLVNNGVFTTGFDCPQLDLIVMLRPTQSPGLWVQMLGRGTRPFPGKTDCLVLDFAGNTKRLGPINDPKLPRRKGRKGGGEAPVRLCEKCDCYSHASARVCEHCGEEFPRAVKIRESATEEAVMKESAAPIVEIFPVSRLEYHEHIPRTAGKPPSIRVVYWCGLRAFSEYICLEHGGFAAKKARDWWRARSMHEPPEKVEQAMPLVDELSVPSHIRVWVNDQHPRVMAHDFTGTAFGTQAAGQKSALPQETADEDVPF